MTIKILACMSCLVYLNLLILSLARKTRIKNRVFFISLSAFLFLLSLLGFCLEIIPGIPVLYISYNTLFLYTGFFYFLTVSSFRRKPVLYLILIVFFSTVSMMLLAVVPIPLRLPVNYYSSLAAVIIPLIIAGLDIGLSRREYKNFPLLLFGILSASMVLVAGFFLPPPLQRPLTHLLFVLAVLILYLLPVTASSPETKGDPAELLFGRYPHGIAILDENEKVIYINSIVHSLFPTIRTNEPLPGEISPLFRQPGEFYLETVKHYILLHSTVLPANSYGWHTLITLNDITERKLFDEAWRRYEFIVNTSREFMTLIKRDYTYEAVNEAYCRAHELNRGDIIGYHMSHVWGEEKFNQAIRPRLDSCFRGEETHYQDWFQFGPLGNRYMDVTYYPYRNLDGKISHCVVVSHDITELKQTEDKLREELRQRQEAEEEIQRAHLQIRQLMTSIKSIIIGLSRELTVTHWNPTASELLAVDAENANNRFLEQLPVAWNWEPIRDALTTCRDRQTAVQLDFVRLLQPDGQSRILELNINPIQNEDRQFLGFIIWGTEITEKIRLESRLMQSQKLESIGHLAAGIAHEINTPIQYVGDNIYFLRDTFSDLAGLITDYIQLEQQAADVASLRPVAEALSAKRKKIDWDYLSQDIPNAIEQSLEGVQRVTRIVGSMKEFSHPSIEEKTLSDINRAIESTVTISRNEWKYVADLVTDLDPNLPLVPCFPGEFNQVILNLIVNAAHAISDVVGENSNQKGTITISTRTNGDSVEIRLNDTGTGIPEAVRNRIFDPFFTTKEVGRGTGQGLSIAHSVIVEKHKGTISFETETGKGTTFIINLPLQSGSHQGE